MTILLICIMSSARYVQKNASEVMPPSRISIWIGDQDWPITTHKIDYLPQDCWLPLLSGFLYKNMQFPLWWGNLQMFPDPSHQIQLGYVDSWDLTPSPVEAEEDKYFSSILNKLNLIKSKIQSKRVLFNYYKNKTW